jgi:hypothetical protein
MRERSRKEEQKGQLMQAFPDWALALPTTIAQRLGRARIPTLSGMESFSGPIYQMTTRAQLHSRENELS